MRAFVTGIGGQDGSYLAERLLADGYDVHALVYTSDGHPEHCPEQVVLHRGDVTDVDGVRSLLLELDPHEVFNLAAISSVAQSWEQPDLTARVNGLGAVALLETALAVQERHGHPVAFVQASSAEMFGDHTAIRTLVRFADEELKHQMLFARYRRSFDKGFGVPCEVLSSAAEVAGVILGKHRIAVMLITLHIEWMTQQHYTESVKDDSGVDPLFKKLLKHHWLEEAQHARIDALEL